MKLNAEEKDELKLILKNYKSIYKKIEEKEIEMKRLEEDIKQLLNELINNRNHEKSLIGDLEMKYNKKFDLKNLQQWIG